MSNLEAVEQQVLSRLMAQPDLYWEVSDSLTPDHFQDVIWKAVWIGLEICHKEGAFDLHLVEANAPYEGDADVVARLKALAAKGKKIEADIQSLIKPLVNRFKLGELQQVQLNLQKALNGAGAKAATIAEQVANDLQAIADEADDDGPVTVHASAMNVYSQMKEAQQSGGLAIPTGFLPLDDLLAGGLMPEELLVLGAPAGVGKSALAYAICDAVARNGGPVFYEQNEMTADQMSTRRLSALTQIPSHKIRTGTLTEKEEEKLVIAAQGMTGLPLHLSASSKNTIQRMHRKAAAMKARMGLSLIVLDSIKMTPVDDQRMNSPDRLPARCEFVVGYCKFIAKDLGVPVIAIAHDKREARDPLQRIKRDDLYGGGAVEQQADNVIIIHRPEDALLRNEPLETGTDTYLEWERKLEEWRGIAELHADKVRMGRANRKAQVYWDGATTTFYESKAHEDGLMF